MGQLFECNDETIWSPSRDVGLYFLAQARHLELCLKVPSGLVEAMSDTIEIDVVGLTRFLISLGKWTNLDNSSMKLLLNGVVLHLLALLGSCIPLPEDLLVLFPNTWTDDAKSLALRVMTPIN
jgi:Family of unknown function (DUF6086)